MSSIWCYWPQFKEDSVEVKITRWQFLAGKELTCTPWCALNWCMPYVKVKSAIPSTRRLTCQPTRRSTHHRHVGRHTTDTLWRHVGRQSADSRPSVGRLSTDCRLTVDQRIGPCVGQRVGGIGFFTFTHALPTSGVPQNVDVVPSGSIPSLQSPKSVKTIWPYKQNNKPYMTDPRFLEPNVEIQYANDCLT